MIEKRYAGLALEKPESQIIADTAESVVNEKIKKKVAILLFAQSVDCNDKGKNIRIRTH